MWSLVALNEKGKAEGSLGNQRETLWIWSAVCRSHLSPVHNRVGSLVVNCRDTHSTWSAHAQIDDLVCGELCARWDDPCIPDVEAAEGHDMDAKARSCWTAMLESSWGDCVRKDVASDSVSMTWSAVLSTRTKTADDSCSEARQKRKTSRKIRMDDEET